MTARDFCYWLQGYFEVLGKAEAPPDTAYALKGLNPAQTECVRRHLDMVFAHEIDPAAGGPHVQAKLNAMHHGLPTGSTPRC